MKNKNLAKIIITAILIIGIPSCDCGSLTTNLKFKGFEMLLVETKHNNSWSAITGNNSNNIDSLRFNLTPILVATTSIKRSKSNSFFIQSSYACSPAEFLTVDNEITDVSIFSSNDVNEKYPAGSNLADLFSIPGGFLIGKKYLSNDHYYYLKQHPATKGKHSFTFKITMKDTIIMRTSQEILIE